MKEKKKRSVDPLFQLFEHFLITRSYDDSAAFTKQLAEQYVAYLDTSPAHVPFHVRKHLLEDLQTEAHELLVRKMYGCVNSSDYENRGIVMRIRGDEGHEEDFLPTPPPAPSTEDKED